MIECIIAGGMEAGEGPADGRGRASGNLRLKVDER